MRCLPSLIPPAVGLKPDLQRSRKVRKARKSKTNPDLCLAAPPLRSGGGRTRMRAGGGTTTRQSAPKLNDRLPIFFIFICFRHVSPDNRFLRQARLGNRSTRVNRSGDPYSFSLFIFIFASFANSARVSSRAKERYAGEVFARGGEGVRLSAGTVSDCAAPLNNRFRTAPSSSTVFGLSTSSRTPVFSAASRSSLRT